MVGYGSNQKGYRLYDLNIFKFIHSRDVNLVLKVRSCLAYLSNSRLKMKMTVLKLKMNPQKQLLPPSQKRICVDQRVRYGHNISTDPTSVADSKVGDRYGERNGVTSKKTMYGN